MSAPGLKPAAPIAAMTKSSACAGRGEVRRKAALVADRGVVACGLQRSFQRMEDFGAHAQGFGEVRRADRRDHEFLEVDRIVGMRAAIEDVHHRHRQQRRLPRRRDSDRAAARGRAPRPWRRRATRREWRWRRAASCSRCRRDRGGAGRARAGRRHRSRSAPCGSRR